MNNLESIIARHALDILEKLLNEQVLDDDQQLDNNTLKEIVTVYDYFLVHEHEASPENNAKIVNLLYIAIRNNQYQAFAKIASALYVQDFTVEQVRDVVSQCLQYRRSRFFSWVVDKFDLLCGYPIAVGRKLYDLFYIYDDADRSLLRAFPDIIYSDAEMLEAITTSDSDVLSCILRQAQLDMDKWLEYAAMHNFQIAVSMIKRLCGHHTVRFTLDQVEISDGDSTGSSASEDSSVLESPAASPESTKSQSSNHEKPPYMSLNPVESFGGESAYQYALDAEIKEEYSTPTTPLLFSEDNWKQEFDKDYMTWFN